MHDITEADWKVFKRLRALALDRFCARVLSEVATLSQQPEKTNHERYLDVFTAVQERNYEMARAFDDLSRSRAFLHLMLICRAELLTAEELSQFSPEYQERLKRSRELF